MYVDTKTCLEKYSTTLIKQRLPPPTDYTIILELEGFGPGTGPDPAVAEDSSAAGSSAAPKHEHSSRSNSVSAAASRASASSAHGPTPPTVPPIPPPVPASNSVKRKADASPTVENPRRLKLVFREGEKTEEPVA